MSKPKISSDWMAGCAGCHMSLLDMDERLVKIAELADIRATPITDGSSSLSQGSRFLPIAVFTIGVGKGKVGLSKDVTAAFQTV